MREGAEEMRGENWCIFWGREQGNANSKNCDDEDEEEQETERNKRRGSEGMVMMEEEKQKRDMRKEGGRG